MVARMRLFTAARLKPTSLQSIPRVFSRPLTTVNKIFREGDIVLLRRTDSPDAAPILTRPLQRGEKTQSHRGAFLHDEIIGKEARDVVNSSAGKDARIHIPTLSEYVTLTPRLVTPVYPGEANLIVSLLDIHVTADRDAAAGAPFEILEAGTGHGALTLHLGRAVHAANAHLWTGPAEADADTASSPSATTSTTTDELANTTATTAESSSTSASPSTPSPPPTPRVQLTPSLSRNAIIHTLDINPAHSTHARKVIQNFRRGLYAPNIDFHTGTISDFLSARAAAAGHDVPFLSCVVLDLPAAHDQLAAVARAMRDDAVLAVFSPSVTQVARCVETCRVQGLPLFLEQVVELGANVSAGRQWDVRLVRPRAGRRREGGGVVVEEKAEAEADAEGEGDEVSMAVDAVHGSEGREVQQDEGPRPDARNDWELVCRPKVGDRITGGGFLGLWRRTKQLKPRGAELTGFEAPLDG